MIGPRILEIRKRLGLTQRVFADIVGVSQGAISEAETGKRGLAMATVVRIADALRLDLDEVTGRAPLRETIHVPVRGAGGEAACPSL